MGKIFVIGVGPGPEELLTPAAAVAIEKSGVLVGGKRILKRYDGKEKKAVGANLDEAIGYIRANKDKGVGVLTSGDPCFYSLLGRILKEFPKDEVEIIPGISSMQLCFARIKETLNDAAFVSLHGRGLKGLSEVAYSKKLVILTDSDTPANVAAEYLLKFVSWDRKVYVGENLGLKGERITEGSLGDIAKNRFSGNAVMVVIDDGAKEGGKVSPGIPDEHLEKGKAPMTKEEVRAVALSKLRLKGGSTVYDVGAGAGSISVEAGLLARRGVVYSVEKDEDRAEIIRKNISNFALGNVRVVKGEAPAVLEDLPVADRIFIGGSGGRLAEILQRCDEKLADEGRMVMNFISAESLSTALTALERLGYEKEVTQLIVNKSERHGGTHAIVPKTSVFILSAWRKTK